MKKVILFTVLSALFFTACQTKKEADMKWLKKELGNNFYSEKRKDVTIEVNECAITIYYVFEDKEMNARNRSKYILPTNIKSIEMNDFGDWILHYANKSITVTNFDAGNTWNTDYFFFLNKGTDANLVKKMEEVMIRLNGYCSHNN